MTEKVRVYFADHIWEKLHPSDQLVGGTVSERVNEIVSRYDAIIQDAMPACFGKDAWLAIMDANNGSISQSEPASLITMVWANVADSPELDEKWNVSTDAIVRQLRSLPLVSQIAVVEAVYRFWSNPSDGQTHEQCLAYAGILQEGNNNNG